jgi:hypothetical protein
MTHHRNRALSSLFVRILVVLTLVCVTLVAAEVVFRRLLFSDVAAVKWLKKPALYAEEFSEDYFKLAYRFIGAYVQPNDRFLGWVNHRVVAPVRYTHADDGLIGAKTPVLLYGDSFAQCATPKASCFDGILNANPRFNSQYYLVNYGVNGYGMDQIYLLYTRTVGRYSSPAVIISLLDQDLDRSLVGASWQTKPFFTLNGGELVYQDSHMDPDIHHFFALHPPEIASYLYRLFLHSHFLPERIGEYLRDTQARRTKIMDLNRAILLAAAADLKRRSLKHVFLVFESALQVSDAPDWRIRFLTEVFRENHIPYIMVRDIFAESENPRTFDAGSYILDETNHHPSPEYNALVCRRIMEWLQSD